MEIGDPLDFLATPNIPLKIILTQGPPSPGFLMTVHLLLVHNCLKSLPKTQSTPLKRILSQGHPTSWSSNDCAFKI